MNFNIDFMGRRKMAMVLSLTLLTIAIGSLATRGLNFGLDFTGGTLLEVGFEPGLEAGLVVGHAVLLSRPGPAGRSGLSAEVGRSRVL